MMPTLEGRLTTSRRGRSLLGRIRAFQRPEPHAQPWRGRPAEAYRVLEDARAVIAQGWLQDHWFVHRPTDGPAFCLVGAVVQAAQQGGSGDPVVTAGPALDYLWDAWQESRGLGGTELAGLAAPRELRIARIRDLARWNDRPGRTRDEVLGLVDLAATRAVMAAVGAPR